jgi:hypothetical protein
MKPVIVVGGILCIINLSRLTYNRLEQPRRPSPQSAPKFIIFHLLMMSVLALLWFNKSSNLQIRTLANVFLLLTMVVCTIFSQPQTTKMVASIAWGLAAAACTSLSDRDTSVLLRFSDSNSYAVLSMMLNLISAICWLTFVYYVTREPTDSRPQGDGPTGMHQRAPTGGK